MADQVDDAVGDAPAAAVAVAVEPQEIRQDMVDTAVKFLTNPKVVDSPISRKTAFLEDKGITPAEIQRAMDVVAGHGLCVCVCVCARVSERARERCYSQHQQI